MSYWLLVVAVGCSLTYFWGPGTLNRESGYRNPYKAQVCCGATWSLKDIYVSMACMVVGLKLAAELDSLSRKPSCDLNHTVGSRPNSH